MEDDPTLRIVLEGQLGDITVDALVHTLQETLGILKQLDAATVRRTKPSLAWYITGLSEGSATLDLRGRPTATTKRPRRAKPVADPMELARTLVAGLEHLQTGKGMPEMFAEQSVRRVGHIGRLLEDGARGLTVIGPPPAGPGDTRPRSVHLSSTAAQFSDQAGKAVSRGRSSLIGRLERVDLHGKNRFGIYNSRSTGPVTCLFSPEQLQTVVDALGHRVHVDGILSRNKAGDPLRIEVDGLSVLPNDEDLPTIADIYRSDPDFTGGLSPDEFVRRLREA